MKILNICLAGSYNIGWGYQDNLITKYQYLNGNDVTILTSSFINDKKGTGYLDTKPGIFYDGPVKVIRLEHFISSNITKYFRKYKDLYINLCSERPDFIFIHGCQFVDIFTICKYLKKHKNIYVCVDNHADYTNTAKTPFARFINKSLWRLCAQSINRYASIFYGVIPIRCDFLHDMYKIPTNKIDLLVMGADDEKVEKAIDNRACTRQKLEIKNDDFVIITGGKIDIYKKGILNLMKFVNKQNNGRLKLLIFGSVSNELKDEFNDLLKSSKYLGWIDQDKMYDVLCASDLAVYPGRHSVIWEQTVGCGVPSVFLDLPNTKHVDVNGNCLFLKNDSENEISDVILKILNDKKLYGDLVKKSKLAARKFSYKDIARYSIEKTILFKDNKI